MFTAIPAITISVALLDQAVKWISKNVLKKSINKYIPVFSVVFGLFVSLICYYTIPGVLPNDIDLLSALIIGVISGSASTGIDQIGRQHKKSITISDVEPTDETIESDVEIDETTDNVKTDDESI